MAGEVINALEVNKRDSDELREKWQELEDQLQYLKNSSDIPVDEGVQELAPEQRQGGQVQNDLQSDQSDTAALERLKGHTDSFAPADETLNTDEDKASDWEIRRLKDEVENLTLQVKRNQDPDKADELEEELKLAKAKLSAKGSAYYRRLYTQYVALFDAGG